MTSNLAATEASDANADGKIRRVDVYMVVHGQLDEIGHLTLFGARQVALSVARLGKVAVRQVVQLVHDERQSTADTLGVTCETLRLANPNILRLRSFGLEQIMYHLGSEFELDALDQKVRANGDAKGGTVDKLLELWPAAEGIHKQVRAEVITQARSVIINEETGRLTDTDNKRPPVVVVCTHPWIAAAGSHMTRGVIPCEGDIVRYPVVFEPEGDAYIAPHNYHPCPLMDL